MTDKVQKIREEVKRLQNELIQEREKGYGSDVDDACILELQNVLTYIDSLQKESVNESVDFEQELYKAFGQVKDFTLGMRIAKRFYDMGKKSREPVSEDLEEAAKHYLYSNILYDDVYVGNPTDKDCIEMFKAGAQWQKAKDEFCSKDLGEYINELSKQFPEVSFAKLSRITVRVAKWQKENLWKTADGDDLPIFDREVIVFTQPYPLEGNEYAVSFAHRPNPDGWDGKSLTSGKVEHYTPKTYDKGGWNIPNVKWWIDVELPKEIES